MFFVFLWLFAAIATLVFMVRNHAVYSERMIANEVIFKQDDYFHYIGLKHQVTYDDMMRHFWVWPVRKMWPQELQDIMK